MSYYYYPVRPPLIVKVLMSLLYYYYPVRVLNPSDLLCVLILRQYFMSVLYCQGIRKMIPRSIDVTVYIVQTLPAAGYDLRFP